MTTYQGVAAATQALRYSIESAVHRLVPEAVTTLDSPTRQAAVGRDEPRIGVYLIHVAPDPTRRPADLPTRTPGGELMIAPVAAVDLQYLVTFFGSAPVAHLLLGAVEIALRERAYLDPPLVRSSQQGHTELAGSGLELQQPPATVTPMTPSVEEMSRIWSGFFQVPYTLSTIYRVSHVIMRSSSVPQVPVLPVTAPKVRQGRPAPRLAPLATLDWATGLSVPVSGTDLRAGDQLVVGGKKVRVDAVEGSEPGLAFRLPAGVGCGPVVVSVADGDSEQVLMLRPTVGDVQLAGRRATMHVEPSLHPDQQPGLQVIWPASRQSLRSVRGELDSVDGNTTVFTMPSGIGSPAVAVLEVEGVSALPAPVVTTTPRRRLRR